jgi:hypothetical protein
MKEGAVVLEKVEERTVARTEVGPVIVSTIFLALDHNHYGRGAPVLFETMIFFNEGPGKRPDEWADHQERYTTWELAEAGHARAIAWVKETIGFVDIKIPKKET